jgi:hypothetical protein
MLLKIRIDEEKKTSDQVQIDLFHYNKIAQ